MSRPVLVMLVSLGLCGPGAAAQQPAPRRTLPAFGSERALAEALRGSWEERARMMGSGRRCPGKTTAALYPAEPRLSAGPADRVRIRGRVLDIFGCPLARATVALAGTRVGTRTDTAGRYRIDVRRDSVRGVQPLRVAVTGAGWKTGRRSLALPAGRSAVLDFRLWPEYGFALKAEAAGFAATAAPTAQATDAAEGITNVQQAGVDEGGIVKLHGDHLVVLRRGRLFTLALGGSRLAPSAAVNAFGPDMDGRGTWYDELLIAGNRVVVIGYSYARGGTEIGLFDIDRAGGLRYRRTFHLRSGDYYSSRNYASRLVGSKLVLYSPVPVPYGPEDFADWAPAVRWWQKGADHGDFQPITTPARVYRPGRDLAGVSFLVLHTVTTCELATDEPTCVATSVLGPPGRVFYVSRGSVFVWTSDWPHYRKESVAPALLYRIPLDGSAPSALGVAGSPIDQFSFLESEDGQLNVLVRDAAWGDGMWSAERGRGRVALLRLPLTAFGNGSGDASPFRYTALPQPARPYYFHNRFVGDWLLYGTGSGWWSVTDTIPAPTLYVVRWQVPERAAVRAPVELSLPHGIDRIEPMGGDAVVIGTDGHALHFSAVRLERQPRLAQHYALAGAQQGELRSHGFFYKPDGPESGTLGLPIRGGGEQGYEHLFRGSAAVIFLRNGGDRFTPLGRLESHVDKPVDDGCVASCVDWYGNARPIFLGGRILALLGYELVEGTMDDGRLRETRRLDFTPERTVARVEK